MATKPGIGRKKSKENALLASFDASPNPQETLAALLQHLRTTKGLTKEQLVDAYEQRTPEQTVPVTVFSAPLGPAESLVKYLKETRRLKFRDISRLLHRDQRTVWASYHSASKKHPAPLAVHDTTVVIPLSHFHDRSLSVLEHLSVYLHTTLCFSIQETARLINRDPSLVRTCLWRARQKQKQAQTQSQKPGRNNTP